MIEKPFIINNDDSEIKIGSNGFVDIGCDISNVNIFKRRAIDTANRRNIEMLVINVNDIKIYIRQPSDDQVKVFVSKNDLYGI